MDYVSRTHLTEFLKSARLLLLSGEADIATVAFAATDVGDAAPPRFDVSARSNAERRSLL